MQSFPSLEVVLFHLIEYTNSKETKPNFMKDNAVHWFEIYVNDIDKAKAFYEGVFEVTLERLTSPTTEKMKIEMQMFPGTKENLGAMGAICKMDSVQPGTGGTIVYFECQDCAVEQARVSEFGGGVQQSKYSIGEHGFISMITDPCGNTIGLHSNT